MKPLVSIVMPVWNEEAYISDAIHSIITQGLVGCQLELIVVDDGSTDTTWKIAAEIADKDPRLKLMRNPKKGKVSAFNYGVEQSTGDFLCFFAGDDIMPGGSLNERVKAISGARPEEPTVLLCRLQVLSDDPRRNGAVVPKTPTKGTTSGATIMMNRCTVEKCFPIPESLPNEDTWLDLCVNFLPSVRIAHSGVIGCNWRMHAGNSVSLAESFEVFFEKVSKRRAVYLLFYNNFNELIEDNKLSVLEEKIRVEELRKSQSILRILRILLSSLGTIEKLRAASFSSRFLFQVRKFFFAFFSGR